MRLPHCGAFSKYLPWVDKTSLVLPKCNAMRKTHAKTECGNSPSMNDYLGREWIEWRTTTTLPIRLEGYPSWKWDKTRDWDRNRFIHPLFHSKNISKVFTQTISSTCGYLLISSKFSCTISIRDFFQPFYYLIFLFISLHLAEQLSTRH